MVHVGAENGEKEYFTKIYLFIKILFNLLLFFNYGDIGQ